MGPHITQHRQGFPLGLNWITAVEDASFNTGIAVGVLRLAAGAVFSEVLERETAWLLMEGEVECLVQSAGDTLTANLRRGSIFDEPPSGAHVAAGTQIEFRARSAVEFTIYATANRRGFSPHIFRDVPDEHRGRGLADGACYRLVRTILERGNTPPEAELVLGEVVTLPGRWAGFPPHRHPQPEIYHYRFSRPHGFGYSDVAGEVFRVEQYDTVKIMGGLTHPQVAAPGYAMYFSWVIRHLPQQPYLKPTLDIHHAWVTSPNAEFVRPAGLHDLPPTAVHRPLDLICLGRVAVDLYGEQIGAELKDVTSFARYLGGCAGNIAVGTARLGLKSAMLSRVGDEQMGHFVRDTLAAEGVDVSHLGNDPSRLTGLAVLSIRSRDAFPLLFYRENCADMAIDPADVDSEFIASARALLVTGTHMSTPAMAEISRMAIEMARAAGTRVVLDIDFRPVLWGLASKGEGGLRYVASEAVSAQLAGIVHACDLVVGTEEEFHIAGGAPDTLAALGRLREMSGAVFVVKRGAGGCAIFAGEIPPRLDDALVVPPARIALLNVLGAGDAFMSGFLRGWLRDEPLERCGLLGNLAGALVTARHGCAPAMPTLAELEACLARPEPLVRPDADPQVERLHHLSRRRGAWPELMVLAFDHRNQVESLVEQAGQGWDRIPHLKGLIGRAAAMVAAEQPGRAGVLVDDRYGDAALMALSGRGLWIGRPAEASGSRPLTFEAGMNVGLHLRRWPASQTVKCLVRIHPDDPVELRDPQDRRIVGLYHACQDTGHELMLEVLPPEGSTCGADTLARALERLYGLGVWPDWWKLGPQPEAGWHAIERVITAHDANCRGILLAGVDASMEALVHDFAVACCRPLVRGFAVGRTIWGAPSRAWLAGRLDDQQLVAAVADGYRQVIELWRECRLACGQPTGKVH